ncbi:hypothetical protein NKH49_30490 [Mesorhizobium sp. M1088]|uniref:hypothetical protein n=1 Tax=unclassified Mesorhizobium TaxID=325217 RepID=UPI00333502CD
MTKQKHSAQTPAVSRGKSNANDALPPTIPAKRQTSHRKETAFFVAQNLQTAPVPCRAMSSSTGTFLIFPEETAKWWTSRAIAAWLALAVSQVLEQSARRRLMRRKAVDSRRNHDA